MMHEIVIDELERYLSGNASQAFHKHLDACDSCRTEVALIAELSSEVRGTFGIPLPETAALDQPDDVPVPSAAFYSKVARRINADQQNRAFGLLSFSESFFRRLAFASLMLLAGLGSYLVTRETSYAGEDVAVIMAEHDPSAVHAPEQDRSQMLVKLASYTQ